MTSATVKPPTRGNGRPLSVTATATMIISTKALLTRSPHPSEAEVMEALRHNLCRCGAHIEIIRAAMRAAGLAIEARD